MKLYETVEQGHRRIETRRYWTMGNTEYLIPTISKPDKMMIEIAL